MSAPWLASGRLNDGTLLLGPLKESPKQDLGPVLDVVVNGITYYVVYTGKALSDLQKQEIEQWAKGRLSIQEP